MTSKQSFMSKADLAHFAIRVKSHDYDSEVYKQKRVDGIRNQNVS